MNEFIQSSVTFGVVLSLAAYEAGLFIKRKTGKSFCNPLLIAIILVILCLLLFQIDYDTYLSSAKYLSYLLTPATVCLAIPLYRQASLLRRNYKAILGGIFVGTMTSLCSILTLALIFQMSHEQYVTLLPKSITTAIGIGVAEELGGYTTITVIVIVVTGVVGNILAEWVCKTFHIYHPIAKGIAIGTASHAIGTTKAMEMGAVEGAMSSLAIVMAGITTAVLTPLLSQLH